jgi:hypothetical protein
VGADTAVKPSVYLSFIPSIFPSFSSHIPLAGALAVGPWAAVPNRFVRHDCGRVVGGGDVSGEFSRWRSSSIF